MKLLNLDELVKINRQVTLNGVTYDVVEQSVGEMIEAVQTAKRIEDAKDDPEVVLQAMVKTASRLLPDCPMDTLNRLSMKQLSMLIQFATASDEDVAQAIEEEGSEAPKA